MVNILLECILITNADVQIRFLGNIERKVSSGNGYKNVLSKSNFSNIGGKYKQEHIQENILI